MSRFLNLTLASLTGLFLVAAGTTLTAQVQTGSQDPIAQERPAENQQIQDGHSMGQQEVLAKYFASKLYLANHGQVQLGKMATEQANDVQVKEFAQLLINEHLRLNQQLKQFAPATLVSKIDAMNDTEQEVAGDDPESRLPNTGDPIAPEATKNLPERVVGNEPVKPLRETNFREQNKMANSSEAIVMKLCEIDQKAAENYMGSTKELLDNYQGEDFDMGYLGMQIASHTWMIAELEAIQGVGSREFQQVVETELNSTKTHLEKARKIAQRLETVNSSR